MVVQFEKVEKDKKMRIIRESFQRRSISQQDARYDSELSALQVDQSKRYEGQKPVFAIH